MPKASSEPRRGLRGWLDCTCTAAANPTRKEANRASKTAKSRADRQVRGLGQGGLATADAGCGRGRLSAQTGWVLAACQGVDQIQEGWRSALLVRRGSGVGLNGRATYQGASFCGAGRRFLPFPAHAGGGLRPARQPSRRPGQAGHRPSVRVALRPLLPVSFRTVLSQGVETSQGKQENVFGKHLHFLGEILFVGV